MGWGKVVKRDWVGEMGLFWGGGVVKRDVMQRW